MSSQIPVITIDGPGGTGKGTISQLVARQLGWGLLDSGVLYRALAMAAQNHGVNHEDEDTLKVLAAHLDIQFTSTDDREGSSRILLEGEDVTDIIRTDAWAGAASAVAVIQSVRHALLDRQRAFRVEPGLVADGRDMGTVIFPDAFLKIFLVASCEERANRRYQQLKDKGINANLDEILSELILRDERDTKRAVAPLKPADDALTIDTTELYIHEVVSQVLQEVENRRENVI